MGEDDIMRHSDIICLNDFVTFKEIVPPLVGYLFIYKTIRPGALLEPQEA